MDHSMHGGDEEGGCSMMMIFHAGHCESILLSDWTATEVGPFIGAAIVIFIISFLYEGLKYYREVLYAADARIQLAGMQRCKDENLISPQHRSFRESISNKYHIIQTVLHLVQVTVSYLLMLIAMTYNVWLFLAIIFGAAAGYFCFGWIKSTTSMDTNEHCH